MMILALLAAQAAAVAATPAAVPVKDKKICRQMEPDTGSHFPGKRICHTKSEWAATDAANEEGARALSDHASRIQNATIN